MSKKKYNVVELFSGIGSQAKALSRLGIDYNVTYTCEWNFRAMIAYKQIHNYKNTCKKYNDWSKEDLIDYLLEKGISINGKTTATKTGLKCYSKEALCKICSTIDCTSNLVDISKVKGTDIKESIDLMTYSFPCQDLSNVGALHGYNKGIDRNSNSRSGLLWEVERILLERQNADLFLPKFLLMENVPALNSSRHRANFDEWKSRLESLGYYNKQYILNANDFGLPQNRNRLLMLSMQIYGDNDIKRDLDKYFEKNNLEDPIYRKNININKEKLTRYLKTDYRNKTYKNEALECQPNDTVSRRKIWDENLQITNNKCKVIVNNVATITTKQDRHPNSGNISVKFDNGKSAFRYLTPRECFLLMGFDESDFEKVLDGNFELQKNSKVFERDALHKMAGNSIAVNVLEAVFSQMLEIDNSIL